MLFYPHFVGEATKARRPSGIYPSSQSWDLIPPVWLQSVLSTLCYLLSLSNHVFVVLLFFSIFLKVIQKKKTVGPGSPISSGTAYSLWPSLGKRCFDLDCIGLFWQSPSSWPTLTQVPGDAPAALPVSLIKYHIFHALQL